MRIERADLTARKGWYLGPWNADLPIALGYATECIDDPHLHRRMTEIYAVTQDWAVERIEQETVRLDAGDVLVVAPGEAHTFLASSPSYLHVVLHVPGLPPEEARADRVPVPRARVAGEDSDG